MVRQNHIDIDSDSSESKSYLLPWNTNTLPLPSKKHKESKFIVRDVVENHNLPETSMEKDQTKKEEKLKEKNKHRKFSLGVPAEKTVITKEKSQYNTLPHHRSEKSLACRSVSVSQACSKSSNVQKRRRRSHGLTIKIESPTTGEDSSAGIIDSAVLTSSPSNIYLSGVSISRGHSPLSSPGPGSSLAPEQGRHSRSPSLTMPPASPFASLARTNRVRSASLAVSSYSKTPPHSPGCMSLAPNLSPFRLHSNLAHFNFPVHAGAAEHALSQLGSLHLYSESTSTLSSVLHVQDANLSSDDFHESILLNKLQKTPRKRKKSKKSRSNSRDLTLN